MRRSLVLPVAMIAGTAMITLAACTDVPSTAGDDDPVEAADLGDGEPGAAEDTEITVAIPFPDITMYSMYVVGTELGFYEDEGLSVEVITADNVNAAVSSGSADIGVESAGAVIEAVRAGVGVMPLAGHFCRQNFDFAVQPGVTSVDQLAGTDVVLAGTTGDPAEFQRQRVLKEEGWDLEGVDVDIVYPGPDSATWREFFVTDRVSLIPFYGDDRPALDEYGANIVVEALRPWANDLHVAGKGWLADNPNTAVRFLRATMKSLEHILAPGVGEVPENKDEILDIYAANDFEVDELRVQDHPWVLDGHLACPNLYFDQEAWDTTIETQQLDPLPFDEHVDLSYLNKAQELLGLEAAMPSEELVYP